MKELWSKKQSCYDEFKCEWDMHSIGDIVMCLVCFNVHIGRHIDCFYGDHGRYVVGQRNLEGRM